MRNRGQRLLLWYSLLILWCLLLLSTLARPFVLVLSQDDLKDAASDQPDDLSADDWDEFDSDSKPEDELDPGSWRPVYEPDSSTPAPTGTGPVADAMYYSGLRKMVGAMSEEEGDPGMMERAVSEIEAAAAGGHPHAQSAMGFLYSVGMAREKNRTKGFLYHTFASDGGNLQSKMALAYTYSRQEMHEKAVKLYAELAEVAVNSFLISKDSPVIEPVRRHSGAEENKEALRKSKGEKDEDFQILEYQAQKGNAGAMYKIGIFYYFGLRGLRRDHTKALSWFMKAVDKGEPRSMEVLGEIYARGAGAKEYFEKAAENEEPGGYYNLGVLYLKGIGVKRDVKQACKYFIMAANAGQPKAFYQLAKMFHTGVGLKKNLPMGTERDYDRAAEVYLRAKSQSNAQAMFNLGYMHEHGQGLPLDLHLAKRYYDQALEIDPAAKLRPLQACG
ncbi:hypothetical protein RJ639_029978 [Escallonia herrerae]|uniref:ERAD-associated E3 ubiquitin-protein ligase component HRD3A n=1 Tax=Escallonia herrerae TaxID=1293975 RepID=A0AA89BB92_9ASTE|nr:hypothetical protein RJ639_029978 [Escallonia herrerae]